MNDNTSNSLNDTSITQVPAKWIKVIENKFVCSECENESAPETSTPDGIVVANISEIKKKFISNPGSKVTIYGICPVCGMEYEFRYKDADMFLEPSSMMK